MGGVGGRGAPINLLDNHGKSVFAPLYFRLRAWRSNPCTKMSGGGGMPEEEDPPTFGLAGNTKIILSSVPGVNSLSSSEVA